MTGGMDPTTTPELPSLGGSLAVSLLSLGLVCLLAWALLRWLSRRGVGQGMGPIRVLARCPLEPRRSVYLIETAGRCFLVGSGEGGMSLLAEVERSSLDLPARLAGPIGAGGTRLRFGDVLARLSNLANPAGNPARDRASNPVSKPVSNPVSNPVRTSMSAPSPGAVDDDGVEPPPPATPAPLTAKTIPVRASASGADRSAT